jgi:hypothetical protein
MTITASRLAGAPTMDSRTVGSKGTSALSDLRAPRSMLLYLRLSGRSLVAAMARSDIPQIPDRAAVNQVTLFNLFVNVDLGAYEDALPALAQDQPGCPRPALSPSGHSRGGDGWSHFRVVRSDGHLLERPACQAHEGLAISQVPGGVALSL